MHSRWLFFTGYVTLPQHQSYKKLMRLDHLCPLLKHRTCSHSHQNSHTKLWSTHDLIALHCSEKERMVEVFLKDCQSFWWTNSVRPLIIKDETGGRCHDLVEIMQVKEGLFCVCVLILLDINMVQYVPVAQFSACGTNVVNSYGILIQIYIRMHF